MSSPPQPTNFKFNNQGLVNADLDDVFIRKDILSPQSTAWGWGAQGSPFSGVLANTAGAAFQGTNQSSPVQHVSTTTRWVCLANGRYTSAGIKSDGTLWLWGVRGSGRFGDLVASPAYSASPTQTVSTGTNWKHVSIGMGPVSAVKTDGTLWNWGYGSLGALGDNTGTSKSSPVQTVACGTNWKCSMAGRYTGAGLKLDGTLWLWGQNNVGQMGINVIGGSRSSPVQTISTGTDWKQVCTGDGSVVAIKTDGTLWTWPRPQLRGLPNAGAFNYRPCLNVFAASNWKTISTTKNYKATVVGVKTDGTLWIWGYQTTGEFGNNSSGLIMQSSPIQTISSGTNWKCAAVHAGLVAGVKTDGTLWTWGKNFNGALGNLSNITAASSPVQTVASGTNWVQVNIGGEGAGSGCGAFVLALRQ